MMMVTAEDDDDDVWFDGIPVILSKALLLSAVRCVLPFTLPERDDLTLFDISHVCFEQHVYKQTAVFIPRTTPFKVDFGGYS
ncbi:hypothetical protein AVEN_160405-1, partial [Araneus ventricosus]